MVCLIIARTLSIWLKRLWRLEEKRDYHYHTSVRYTQQANVTKNKMQRYYSCLSAFTGSMFDALKAGQAPASKLTIRAKIITPVHRVELIPIGSPI